MSGMELSNWTLGGLVIFGDKVWQISATMRNTETGDVWYTLYHIPTRASTMVLKPAQ